MFYGIVQWGKMLEFDDTDVMISARDSFYDASYVKDDNIMFAFGITKYDSNPLPIEDPTIGLLSAYYQSWGIHAEVKGHNTLHVRNASRQWLFRPRQPVLLASLAGAQRFGLLLAEDEVH